MTLRLAGSSTWDANTDIFASLRKYLTWAVVACIVLVGGMGGWAAFASISGAVVSSGRIVVESSVKQVQHRTGGIIKSILVKDGDYVQAGDVVMTLDDTVVSSNLAVVIKQLTELRGQEARMVAERDQAKEVDFTMPDDVDPTEWESVKRGQSLLFRARVNSVEGRIQQFREQIRQYDQQAQGTQSQLEAKAHELSLIDEELEDLSVLLKKQLVAKSQVTALKREKTRLLGQHGELLARIAQVKESVSEREVQIIQVEEGYRADLLENLQDVRAKIAKLEEDKISAEDELQRVVIRAPQSGYIHELAVHTIGGVLAAEEVAMLVVPGEDVLLVETAVRPVDVDQLRVGQEARIRFPNFDARTTPELTAELLTVSADLETDERTGESHYTVRLKIKDDEMQKLEGKTLVPGMPVEAFVTTQDRTVLSYLMKPVVDQVKHAMREK